MRPAAGWRDCRSARTCAHSSRPHGRAGMVLRQSPIHTRCMPMSGYCDTAPGHPLHGPYHDDEYGVPQQDEAVLFERLLLEINQAGLSWETMLRKREGFRAAYDGFDVARVAAYGEADQARLMADAGIIRNRLKIGAAIHNAGVIL